MSVGTQLKQTQLVEAPNASASAVSLTGVSACYGDGKCVLKDVTVQIARYERVAIMGPSGSGKTSLLGIIAGRLKPTSGEIKVSGRLATIHQDLRLVQQRTALENVLHGAMSRYSFVRSIIGFPKAEKEEAIKLLCRVGLCNKVYKKVRNLSGGEKQRVAIARALMQRPDILLADEPVAALDEENASSIMALLTDLAKERGLTVVTVLHDYALAREFSDRIVRLARGRVVYGVESEPRELKQKVLSERLPVLPYEDTANNRVARVETLRKAFQKARQLKYISIVALIVAACIWALSGIDFSRGSVPEALAGSVTFLANLLPGSWSEVTEIPWMTLLGALVETLQMAIAGTVFGTLISWPLSALAAKNNGPSFIRPVVRTVLNAIRTVPSLVWALLFVAAVGLGTFAGVLALTAYSVGYLTKFFYEAFESVDPGPPDALKELGASGLQRFFHAVWPAAKPAVLSSSFFMLEYNVRAASVLGIVDAGGIGFYIKQYIDFRSFPTVLACLLMILCLVLLFDAASSRLRAKLLGA